MTNTMRDRLTTAVTVSYEVGPPPLAAVMSEGRRRRHRRRQRKIIAAGLGFLASASVAILISYSVISKDNESSPAAAAPGSVIHLVTAPDEGNIQLIELASVQGLLSVDNNGCYRIDDLPAVFPQGSTTVDEGSAIRLPTGSVISVGDRIVAGGGYHKGREEALAAGCINDIRQPVVVLSMLSTDLRRLQDESRSHHPPTRRTR